MFVCMWLHYHPPIDDDDDGNDTITGLFLHLKVHLERTFYVTKVKDIVIKYGILFQMQVDGKFLFSFSILLFCLI